nr:unnamed protein product [Callosobruchus analis]
MVKTIVIVSLIISVVVASDLRRKWEEYKTAYHKQYKDQDEDDFRFQVFKLNMKMIEEHNKRYREGKTPFEMGVNQFSDLGPSELPNVLRGGI